MIHFYIYKTGGKIEIDNFLYIFIPNPSWGGGHLHFGPFPKFPRFFRLESFLKSFTVDQ